MSNNFLAKKPDYTVSAIDKSTNQKGAIGVAWKQSDGSIRIKLNPFLLLDTAKSDLVITLFPSKAPSLAIVDPGSEEPAPF